MANKDPEKKRAYQRLWLRNKREKERAEAEQLEKEQAEVRRLNPYGVPENGARYDKEGRRLGQLDDLYKERDTLEKDVREITAMLNNLEDAKNDTLDETANGNDAHDVEAVIKRRARLNAINDEFKEKSAEKAKLDDQLRLKRHDVARLEAEANALRHRISEYSEGGMLYKNEMRRADYILNEAEGKRSAAEATLKSGQYGGFDAHHWESELSSATESITRAKSTPARLEELRQKAEDTLKVYCLGDDATA